MPYNFYYIWWDPTYILVIIGAVICLAASMSVKGTFAKYSKVPNMSGITGAQAAERILHTAGIYDVAIRHIQGNLTDHYDPRNKVLSLSDSVYDSATVAAVGVAAHECGHAIQHNKNYAPLSIRSAIVPIANFGSVLAWPLVLLGLLFFRGIGNFLITLGIICFLAAVFVQVVTLPVEFNASRRAIRVLSDTGILRHEEIGFTKKVLFAAAMTYVASVAAIVLQLLRLIILSGGRGRRR